MVLGSVPSSSKRPKVTSNLPHLVHHAGGQQVPRGTNQRVAAPIEKPRIAGDHGFALPAPHDERAGRHAAAPPERIVIRSAASALASPFAPAARPKPASRVASSTSAVTTRLACAPAFSGRFKPAGTEGIAGADLPATSARWGARYFRSIPVADDSRRVSATTRRCRSTPGVNSKPMAFGISAFGLPISRVWDEK